VKPTPTDTRKSSAYNKNNNNDNTKKGVANNTVNKNSYKSTGKTSKIHSMKNYVLINFFFKGFPAKTTRDYSIPTKVNKSTTRDTSLTSRSR